VLAVVYFQNSGVTEAYRDDDCTWLERYAAAVGRIFGFYFWKERQERELRERLEVAAASENAPEILGESAHTQALRRMLHKIYIPALEAKNPEPILILGERGTGKDLVARYLHAFSSRHKRPFVVVNCAEITDELAASRSSVTRRGPIPARSPMSPDSSAPRTGAFSSSMRSASFHCGHRPISCGCSRVMW